MKVLDKRLVSQQDLNEELFVQPKILAVKNLTLTFTFHKVSFNEMGDTWNLRSYR